MSGNFFIIVFNNFDMSSLIYLLQKYKNEPNNVILLQQLKEHFINNKIEIYSIINLKKISFQTNYRIWNETNPLYFAAYHNLFSLYEFLLPYYIYEKSQSKILLYKEPCNLLHVLFLQYPLSLLMISDLITGNNQRLIEIMIDFLQSSDQMLFESPLQYLMYKDLSSIPSQIKRFILKHSNINHQNSYGNSALHLAIINKNFHIIDDLIQHKANPYLKNNHKQNAFDLLNKLNVSESVIIKNFCKFEELLNYE